MKFRENGFGGLQIILGIVVVAVLASFAVPQYNNYVDKAKLAEAYTLAGDTKKKLVEFYMTYNRFPKTDGEASVVKTETFAPPEFVRDIVVNYKDSANDIVIEVYLKDGVVENLTGEPQYIYMAGNSSRAGGAYVDWTCGAQGINPDLLQPTC